MPALIHPRGFDRHTFLCPQSGSGKTYSLGVILEHVLVESELRGPVFYPNSDFVRLGTVRGNNSNDPIAEAYRQVASSIEILGSQSEGCRPLRIRVSEWSPAARAAMLQLDLSTIVKSTPHLMSCLSATKRVGL